MTIKLPPPARLRALCLGAFLAVLVQLFVLAEPPLIRELTSTLGDTLMHAAAFGSFAMLLWVAIGFRAPVFNVIAITIVGALDEFHQLFVPGRTGDVIDVVADAAGAALVTYVLHRLASASARAEIPAEAVVETGD